MMLMTMSITFSIMFMFLKHPLSMGLLLILQTMTVAMITGMMINSFWFSYILIITMLSGALVLFIYMASVASNEKFNSSMPLTMTFMSGIMLSVTLMILEDQLSTMKMWSSSKKMMVGNDQMINLMKLFNMHNMFITLMMVSYLFLTMIAISNIVNVYEGPLRMKN